MTNLLDRADAETERFLNARMARRDAADARANVAYDRKAVAADLMIGELVRDGRTVYYVFPVGGKYREGSRFELTLFLIRNDYV